MAPETRARALWMALAIIVLVGALATSCRQFPDHSSVSLATEFATARKGVIVIGQGYAGRPPFRSYLGSNLRFDIDGDWAHGLSDKKGPAFGFFLYETVPLVVTVAGRGPSQDVEFFCGGQALGRFKFAPAKEVSFEVPLPALKPGWNWIEVQNAGGVSFAEFYVRPSGSAVSTLNGRPFVTSLSSDSESLQLPFGQSVEFALESPGLSRLSLATESWVEEGVALPDPGNLILHVRVMKEGQAPSQWSLLGAGPHKLLLPEGLGPFALQLRAELGGPETPLPGQAGIKLSSLLLQRSLPAQLQPTAVPDAEALAPSRCPVILIVVDTLRADRMSVYGYPYPTSPNLDRLAEDSVVFENVTAQSPWTKPSVASILTGLEPNQHNTLDFDDHLDPSLNTLAEVLSGAGYQTYAVVANPLLGQRFEFDQGFDRYISLPVVNNAHRVNRAGLEMLAERKEDKPFFLYLHPIDPHLPYNPPSPWREEAFDWHQVAAPPGPAHPLLPSSDHQGFAQLTTPLFVRYLHGLAPDVPEPTAKLVDALYDGEVASTDAALGRLVDWLKEKDLYQDSMIIVTSDHGEELLERGRLGHMHTLYQELLHIPLIIKFPNGQYRGLRDSGLWQQVDILPTVLAASGISLKGALDGLAYPKDAARLSSRQALFEIAAGADAVEAGQASASYLELGSGLREGSLKLIHHNSSICGIGTVRGLFDLSSDPQEKRDLFLERKVKALFLERELARRKSRPTLVLPKRASDEETREILRSLQYTR